jgi:hypothetical protein
MGRKEDLQRLIEENHRRLQILEERQAKQGIETPAGVIIEIEDIQKKIKELESSLVKEFDYVIDLGINGASESYSEEEIETARRITAAFFDIPPEKVRITFAAFAYFPTIYVSLTEKLAEFLEFKHPDEILLSVEPEDISNWPPS